MKKLLSLCAALLLAACTPKSGIVSLRCEYCDDPIAIDMGNPRFTWAYDTGRGFVQAGCRVVVSNPDGVVVWDSGEIAGSSQLVRLDAEDALQSLKDYRWKVEAWNADRSVVLSSRPASFRTAMLHRKDWTASWIGDGRDKDVAAAPMFRREFTLRRGIRAAYLYYSAAAYGVTWINGKRVGDSVIDPGYTDYSKRSLYTVSDVTALVRPGDNAVGTVLGNGFFNEIQPVATWDFDEAHWRGRARMICQLHVLYEDGSEDVIASDPSWRTCADGPWVSNNIYSGDVYDARKEIPGWTSPGFDDSAWAPAEEVRLFDTDYPAEWQVGVTQMKPRLSAQLCPPVRPTELIKAVDVKHFGDSVTVFDFGRNIAGLPRLRVSGEAGTVVTLAHGELAHPDGRMNPENISIYYTTIPGYENQTDTYILSGKGTETWRPEFTYHGFQYVEVRCSKPLRSLDVQAEYIHTDVAPVGTFSCSDPRFETLTEMARRTYLNNLHSIPTDCPTREKNGWEADAYLAIDLALLGYDGFKFYDKWMDDFLDNITPEGRLSGIIPTAGWGFDDWIGPVWDACAFIIPEALYNYYGDAGVIEKMYPALERYLAYLATREEPDGGVTYGIGDWVYYDTQTPTDFTSTLFYWLDNRLMAKFSGLLGRDGSAYEAKAAQLYNLINTKYFDAASFTYANGSMCALAAPLSLGAVPEEYRQQVADTLARKVAANDYVLDFGSMGSKHVLRMLSKYGHGDVAFRLATGTKAPSWFAWIEKGYSTLPERWILDEENWRDSSLDHVFLGDITAWYVNCLAGINFDPQRPGFAHVLFTPDFVEGLDHISATYNSVRGLVASGWKREGGKVVLTVTLPENTTGTVIVRGSDPVEVGSGTTELTF